MPSGLKSVKTDGVLKQSALDTVVRPDVVHAAPACRVSLRNPSVAALIRSTLLWEAQAFVFRNARLVARLAGDTATTQLLKAIGSNRCWRWNMRLNFDQLT